MSEGLDLQTIRDRLMEFALNAGCNAVGVCNQAGLEGGYGRLGPLQLHRGAFGIISDEADQAQGVGQPVDGRTEAHPLHDPPAHQASPAQRTACVHESYGATRGSRSRPLMCGTHSICWKQDISIRRCGGNFR